MRHVTPIAVVLAGVVAFGFVGCKHDKDKGTKESGKMAAGQKTLWERLGGEDSVRKVVKSFVQKGAKNPKVNFTRAGHPNTWEPTPKNVEVLEQRLVEFISSASGGPLKYNGKDMASAHKDMR